MSDSEIKAYNSAYDEKINTSKKLSDDLYKNDLKKVNQDYNKAVDKALKDVNKKLIKMGSQAIQGFVSGMKTQSKNLPKDIKKISNSIVKEFKKYLKIKSPSRVFADQVGKFIPLGIAEGIKNNTSNVLRDIQGLTSEFINTASNVYGDLKGSQVYNTNNTTNSSKNNTFNFYQTNNSPKNLDRLEIYRQTRNQLQLAKMVIKNA